MRVVVDTNVVISGVFFGGAPRRVLDAIVDSEMRASATGEIVAKSLNFDGSAFQVETVPDDG